MSLLKGITRIFIRSEAEQAQIDAKNKTRDVEEREFQKKLYTRKEELRKTSKPKFQNNSRARRLATYPVQDLTDEERRTSDPYRKNKSDNRLIYKSKKDKVDYKQKLEKLKYEKYLIKKAVKEAKPSKNSKKPRKKSKPKRSSKPREIDFFQFI